MSHFIRSPFIYQYSLSLNHSEFFRSLSLPLSTQFKSWLKCVLQRCNAASENLLCKCIKHIKCVRQKVLETNFTICKPQTYIDHFSSLSKIWNTIQLLFSEVQCNFMCNFNMHTKICGLYFSCQPIRMCFNALQWLKWDAKVILL